MSFRNKKRKIISFAAGFSAIILTAVSTPVFISFAEETSENSPVKSSEKSPEKTSGKCGNNASWSYSGGTLSISGSGEMYDYQSDYQPWINLSDEITSVNISGVSYIGAYNFSNISNLSYAYISESVESIDSNAFSKSASLTLEVKKGGYAEMYAEYAGINYKTYGSSDTDESYEKLKINNTTIGRVLLMLKESKNYDEFDRNVKAIKDDKKLEKVVKIIENKENLYSLDSYKLYMVTEVKEEFPKYKEYTYYDIMKMRKEYPSVRFFA